MAEQLAVRRNLRLLLCERLDDVDIPGLASLAASSWGHDYGGTVRILYDEDYLSWLLGTREWWGLVVLDEESQAIACVFALLRQMRVGEECLPTAYSSQWAVSPACRSLGVGMWLAGWHRRIALERFGRAILMGAFHEGHGSMRVLSLFRDQPDWDTAVCQLGTIWSRPLQGPTANTACLVRPSQSARILGENDGSLFAQLSGAGSTITFAPSEGFDRLYLDSRARRSGTLLLGRAEDGYAVSFSLHTLAFDDEVLGLAGQIQGIHAPRSTGAGIAAALEETSAYLRSRGCMFACAFERGAVDGCVLEAAGFRVSPDRVCLFFGGAPRVIQMLRSHDLRFNLDFL